MDAKDQALTAAQLETGVLTLTQAAENAELTTQLLRGALNFAAPVETIVLVDLVRDAAGIASRVTALLEAIRAARSGGYARVELRVAG